MPIRHFGVEWKTPGDVVSEIIGEERVEAVRVVRPAVVKPVPPVAKPPAAPPPRPAEVYWALTKEDIEKLREYLKKAEKFGAKVAEEIVKEAKPIIQKIAGWIRERTEKGKPVTVEEALRQAGIPVVKPEVKTPGEIEEERKRKLAKELGIEIL